MWILDRDMGVLCSERNRGICVILPPPRRSCRREELGCHPIPKTWRLGDEWHLRFAPSSFGAGNDGVVTADGSGLKPTLADLSAKKG